MLAPNSNNTTIHQTLHGYDDGHRLLESSRSLSHDSERTLLLLSDMSGPTMHPRFKDYLTGYPLPGDNLYAFARTWYAPEMDRPGCVWTHTLLVENSDLPDLKCLEPLLKLFVRPQRGRSWSTYSSKQVLFDTAGRPAGTLQDAGSLDIAERVLAELYCSEEQVFILADDAKQFEGVVIAIWTQQWPRLRRSFRFCTGSLSNRNVDGEPFDLQVLPKESLGSIRRVVPSGRFVHIGATDRAMNMPTWIPLASAELFGKGGNSLTNFLWKFGADFHDGREAFSRLAEIFTVLKQVRLKDLPLVKLVEALKKQFSSAEEATRLKGAILGGSIGNREQLLPMIPESELLRELVTTRDYDAFDAESLRIRSRAKVFWHSEPAMAKRMVLEIANAILTPFVRRVPPGGR